MYGLTIQSDSCFQIISRRWFRVYVWRLIPTQFLPLFSSNTWHHVTCISPPNYCWDKLECDKVLTNSQLYCLNCHNRQIRLCQHDCKTTAANNCASNRNRILYDMRSGGTRLQNTLWHWSLPPNGFLLSPNTTLSDSMVYDTEVIWYTLRCELQKKTQAGGSKRFNSST